MSVMQEPLFTWDPIYLQVSRNYPLKFEARTHKAVGKGAVWGLGFRRV